MGQWKLSADSLGLTEADFGQKTWQAVFAELIATGATPDLIRPFALSRFRDGLLVNERAAAPAAAVH